MLSGLSSVTPTVSGGDTKLFENSSLLPSSPSPSSLLPLFFFSSLFMYECLWYVCGYTSVGVHGSVCTYIRRSQVNTGSHPQLLFYFIHWGRISPQTQSSLIRLNQIASLLWRSLSLLSATTPPGIYLGSGDLNSDFKTCTTRALTSEISLQSWLYLVLLIVYYHSFVPNNPTNLTIPTKKFPAGVHFLCDSQQHQFLLCLLLWSHLL